MIRRVVLLGAGHAHLHAIRRAAAFGEAGAELIVLSPEGFWYSGLATGMLGGAYPPERDRIDVAGWLTRGGGRLIRDRATGIDPTRRLVHRAAGPPLAYDALSLGLGSAPPPLPGAAAGGDFSVKPISQLWALRQDLEARFAAAPGRPVAVAIIGGGATGCELAGNIAGLAAARGGKAAITVVEAGPAILRSAPRGAARAARRALAARGVAFLTDSPVAGVGPGAARLQNGAALPFDLLVNAGGLRPPSLIRRAGLPVDDQGGLIVDAHLRAPAWPEIHGGGDCVAFAPRPLPKTGVYAIRQGPILFHNLLASLDGRPPRRFRPQRKHLWIMNMGDGTGLAMRGGLWRRGRAAFLLKDWIDRRFLDSYALP